MSEASPFSKLFTNREPLNSPPSIPDFSTRDTPQVLPQEQPSPEVVAAKQPSAAKQPVVEQPMPAEQPTAAKRGRPATGKRSDPDWIGRTYYVRKETDLEVEDALLSLKRQGIEIDKSELVDLLLDAWVQWRQGENIEILLGEISPSQKSEITKRRNFRNTEL